ncbi:hypothetical protein, partial [Aeromonas jandaei]|uniref:hypothetical protein n=1 Tax=Aeromonas jandaei TaxID=650 RepID=UPI001ABEE875
MNIKKPTGQLKDTSLESELTAFPQGSNSYEDKGNEASVISTSGQDHATHDFQHGQTHHESDSLPNLLGDEIASFSSECCEGVMRSNALRGAGAGLADLKKLSDAAEIASALNKHSDVMQVAQMAGAGLADLKKL